MSMMFILLFLGVVVYLKVLEVKRPRLVRNFVVRRFRV